MTSRKSILLFRVHILTSLSLLLTKSWKISLLIKRDSLKIHSYHSGAGVKGLHLSMILILEDFGRSYSSDILQIPSLWLPLLISQTSHAVQVV
ncbi:uncharacterized protein LOC130762044 isoform X2 [Actinidia eriantha]|uniref:uncharacterized protein LOC130762044 isoform X2 n=1 Tax=Actinidia eriantha TaxID=165200 RepID=UPI00258DAA48|nr:uncharacterized protein LOC130762044 isoform X2 [Actinidia eriantha]